MMWALGWAALAVALGQGGGDDWPTAFFTDAFSDYANLSRPMPEFIRLELREKIRGMFSFGWDNYIRYAFPLDELDPIHCTGRGPDYENPDNININDVLGDYCLTLVDSLDTLAVMGNRSEFHRAVQLAIEYVSFEKDNVVQVFEVTIRVMGALLSAHMILTDKKRLLGDFEMPGYRGELLTLAEDLAARLRPAFHSATGIPYPRVNLASGVPVGGSAETCLAGAGTLSLEFGVLSRLSGDAEWASLSRQASRALYERRDEGTGLLGSTVNVETGAWASGMAGVGAGLDSYYEYLLKSYILFGHKEDFAMFNQSYARLKTHLRRGRAQCNAGSGEHPLFANVGMGSGTLSNTWVDSLGAAWSGVQLLAGDVDEAVCSHAVYYAIWRKYELLPERFNWQLKAPDVAFYPLRPELAESTYLLYLSTRNPFYLHVGREMMESLEKYTRVRCGYATVHNVHTKTLEDRMESFFLSETLKYLFLLYDEANPVNRNYGRLIFTTEGHIFPIDGRMRDDEEETAAEEEEAIPPPCVEDSEGAAEVEEEAAGGAPAEIVSVLRAWNSSLSQPGCENWPRVRRGVLPLRPRYMAQLDAQFALNLS